MNSRDAAYDESVVKALIEATAVEAAASGIVLPYPPNNEHIGSGKHEDEVDAALPNRRKRKRTDDDKCVGFSAVLFSLPLLILL
jgi:hypothetical protein